MAARQPAKPAHWRRQQERRKRYTTQQQAKAAARAKLPWLLAALGLLILLFLWASGLMWYRSSLPLASLSRADGVLSWVEIRRSGARNHPYELRFATYEQNRILEVYLGQSQQQASYYAYHLHVGDSVRVCYNDDPAKGSPIVYQLEKPGKILLSAEDVRSEDKTGAIAFGLLSLLPLALCLSNRDLRTAIKSYFRRRTA